MKALVLAAGKGTRLGDLTFQTPKPMLPIGDRPLLDHTVRWLKSHGIDEIAINLHHAADVITGWFADGSAHGVHLTYSYEPELLGTAGAARNLRTFLDGRFCVVYGDVFTNVDLSELEAFHDASLSQVANGTNGAGRGSWAESALTMSLYHVPNPWECGIVDVDIRGRVRSFVEKPPREQITGDLANGGILICEQGVLDLVAPGGQSDFGRDVLPKMLAEGKPVFGQPIGPREFIIDMGTPDGYRRAQQAALGYRNYTDPIQMGWIPA